MKEDGCSVHLHPFTRDQASHRLCDVGIKHPTGCAIPQRCEAHLRCRDRTTAGCLISGEEEYEERYPRPRKMASARTAALRKQSAAPAGAFHMTASSSGITKPEIKGLAVAWSRHPGFHLHQGVTTQPVGPLIPTTGCISTRA